MDAQPLPPAVMPSQPRSTHWFWLGFAGVVLAGCAAFSVDQAMGHCELMGVEIPSTCSFAQLTDAGCPGCGLTRSFVLTSRVDSRAWQLHPLGPILFVLVFLQVPYRVWRLWQGGQAPAWAARLARPALPVLAGSLIVVWIWKVLAMGAGGP